MNELFSQISTYGYIILFLYSLGGGFFALVAAAILSYSGKMDISFSILVAIIANFAGDSILFYFGRNYKKEVGEYLKKHRRKMAYAQILIKKYGNLVIVLQKFLYGFKTLVPIVISFTKYDFKKFTILNFFSSILWGFFFGMTGYFGSVTIQKIFFKLYQNNYYLLALALAVFFVIWLFLRKKPA